MDESAVVGQEIGDVSNRWSFEPWDEKFDDLTAEDDGCISDGVSANEVIKSGRILISAKSGLGWYTWRRRWIALTKNALVFFKRDPCIHAGRQVNIILGGILLKRPGSVQIREDKKLLTILFPDVLDRRPFTLKTETMEDLHEWKTALEQCLKQGPSTPPITGSFCHWNAKPSATSIIASSPVSLALKESDGSPSLLEKALCFLEDFGAKVEGVLRISADMEEVQRRIQEFELGNTEFDANEDAHVVADCVKHILRELPVSLVPVYCCQELVKAYETNQSEAQIIALRMVIYEKLPERNLLLFQRILKMMYTICCTPENRMTPPAVAACMAPLLLRPILDGDCNLADDTEFIDDDCSQLLGVAIAAKTAQAIITLILEEYPNIFSARNLSRYSSSVDSEENHGNEDSIDENYELSSSEDPRRSSSLLDSDPYDEMDFSPNLRLSRSYDFSPLESGGSQNTKSRDQCDNGKKLQIKLFSSKAPTPNRKSNLSVTQLLSQLKPIVPSPEAKTSPENIPEEPRKSFVNRKLTALWERDSAKKISSAESLNLHGMEKQLEKRKIELQENLREQAKVNASLQGSLERRKQALIERYLILNEHVEKLQGKLQTEHSLPDVDLDQRITSENLPNQDTMTREEADEIRSGQEVGETPHQLSLLQHLFGSSSDASDAHRLMQSATLHSLLRDLDANLTSEETLGELAIQPNLRAKPKSVRSSNIISSKVKTSPPCTTEENRPRPMSIVAPTFCASGFDKI